MAFRNIHIKAPEDLFLRFSSVLGAKGQNKTEVLIKLIERWVERSGDESSVSTPSNVELLERVKQLESKVKFLEKAVSNRATPIKKREDEWVTDTSDCGADFVLKFDTDEQ